MISIVDDDACARQATEAIIRSLGYALATYESAEDFLSSDQVNNTSCLITDVHMPGLSGVELYRHLSRSGFEAPTIFVTGQPDEATRAHVLAAGAVAFLSKPFGKQTLLDCLRAASLRQTPSRLLAYSKTPAALSSKSSPSRI
jgi:FixJ family two-component response regulator